VEGHILTSTSTPECNPLPLRLTGLATVLCLSAIIYVLRFFQKNNGEIIKNYLISRK